MILQQMEETNVDESQISTNIVPIEKPSEESEVEKIKEEEYNKNLEKDLVQFLEEEFKENTNGELWRYVRDYASKKLGEDPSGGKLKPMTEDQLKSFSKQSIPWGKFEGRLVGTVAKKDPEFLKRMAYQPLLFQIQLRRYLLSIENVK